MTGLSLLHAIMLAASVVALGLGALTVGRARMIRIVSTDLVMVAAMIESMREQPVCQPVIWAGLCVAVAMAGSLAASRDHAMARARDHLHGMALIVMAGLLVAGHSSGHGTAVAVAETHVHDGGLLGVVLTCGVVLFVGASVPVIRECLREESSCGIRGHGAFAGAHHGATALALVTMGAAALI